MEKIAEENFENNLDYILLEKLIQSKNILQNYENAYQIN
jgi:hypothetical protein